MEPWSRYEADYEIIGDTVEEVKAVIEPALALLTFSDYFRINHDLSVARGWSLGNDTARYAEMNPTACKVNVQEDETYEVRLVMPISSEVQIEQAEILQGVELTNSFIPVEQPIQEMVIEILEPDVIDWTISQFLFAGSAEGTLTLEISQESYDEIEPMIEFLDSRGIIIHVL
jgi:hypothetical protein